MPFAFFPFLVGANSAIAVPVHRFFDIEADVDREQEDEDDGDDELYGELRN